MNIVGLNKLGLAPQAPKSQGKASPKDASSFEEALGQVKSETKAKPDAKQDKPQAKSDSRPDSKPQAQTQSQPQPQGRAKSEPQARGSEIEPQAMPTQPSAPVLDSPAVTDRFVNAPNDISTVGPFTKVQATDLKAEESGVDSLTRRAVWNDFLRKMKDELGVSAEDVLGAFDSLSAEDLAKPPGETVDKVVMALGLSPQQTQMAKQFFMDLITRTQPKSMADELAKSEKQISLTLMSQRELDRKSQSKAIDNLNQNFFMKGPYERPAALPAQGQMMPQKMAQAQRLRELDARLGTQSTPPEAAVPFIPSLDPATRMTQMQAMQQETLGADGKMAIPTELQQAANKAPKADVDSILKKFTEGQGQSQALEAGKESFAPQAQAMLNMNANPMMAAAPAVEATNIATPTRADNSAMAAMQAMFGQAGRVSGDEQADSENQEFTSDASYLAPQLAADGQTRIGSGAQSEFQSQLNNVNGPQPMAVPDLVKNAQVMVNEGGGEMKVTLTPDGLGEVAMKVVVKDGKVNVQMITESDEAKRMIERSLGDLKTSLNANHLQVSDIKIDTASNLGKQLEQQYNDAQRQMAQQNLEQFRQDHQGWRRSFFEVPGAKVYKGQADAPRDVQAPTSAASRRAGGSRRLDLVA